VKKNIRLRLQLIERGKIRLKENYTWEKVAEKIYKVYKSLYENRLN
ncbi:unnamed protein product, partial [marine sediment metagenome]